MPLQQVGTNLECTRPPGECYRFYCVALMVFDRTVKGTSPSAPQIESQTLMRHCYRDSILCKYFKTVLLFQSELTFSPQTTLRIHFGLPNMAERVSIFKRYAKQLMDIDLETLGRLSEGLSGRGIKEVCSHAERKFASLKLRGLTSDETPQASSTAAQS